MTVKELINALREFPSALEVLVQPASDDQDDLPIRNVDMVDSITVNVEIGEGSKPLTSSSREFVMIFTRRIPGMPT